MGQSCWNGLMATGAIRIFHNEGNEKGVHSHLAVVRAMQSQRAVF